MSTHARLAAAAAIITAIVLPGLIGPTNPAVAAGTPLQTTVAFHASRATLSDGLDAWTPKGTASELVTSVDGTKDVFSLSGTTDAVPYRGVNYQIGMLGSTTGYWVRAIVNYSWLRSWYGQCTVYKGFPGWKETREATEWTCGWDRENHQQTGERITFTVEPNRDAEASGTLRTSGPVTLKAGKYDGNNLPYLVKGSAELGRDSGTEFAVIMREGDKPIEGDNLARVRFSYRIWDEGRETSYWVVGWSQTQRAAAFHYDAACFITDQPPGGNSVPLDTLNRALTTPYQCTILSQDLVNGYHGTYGVELLVGKREMTTIDNPATAADLVRKYCSTQNDDCNVNLIEAKKVMMTVGDDRKWQAANDTDKAQWDRNIEVETSVQTTHKYSTEVSASAEASFVGQKFAFTVKQSYGFEYQQKTDIKETIPVPVGPREITWVEYQVPMIVADGDVLIFARDQGVNYRLPNVHVEMPQPGGQTPTLKCDRLAGWNADTKGASCFPGSSTPTPVPRPE